MKNLAITFATGALIALAVHTASAQNAILSEMYGRGVHAYYSGSVDEAHQYLSMAIDNGIQDPRAYYFRGMVAQNTGRPEEAESDWQVGAELEANGRANPSIGRSLSRFQGSARLKLESIRQKAKLQALATASQRSQQRYGEINAAADNASVAPSTPPAAAPPAVPVPPAGNNPFADDMAEGQPKVTADDAFAGALEDPFAGEAAPAAAAPAGGNPFGGAGAGAADPFGGGAAADPFGGAPAGGADSDPFGGGAGGADPFGGGDASEPAADPFGGAGDPFGN